MKIPVYRTRAEAVGEAPGRSIRSRMRGDVLANAELKKGEVAGELFSQVGEYSKMRYQAAEEIKLNEALLYAEEGIRNASRDLSRSPQLYNIFEGEKLWDQTTTELREQALDALGGNRFTRQKFTERFGQMEMSGRFQLRGVVDRKIDAAAQAALARRTEMSVVELSDPGFTDPNSMIELYNSRLTGLAVDQGRSVKQGRANPNAVMASNLALKKTIAANVVNGYVSSDPVLAVNLLGALEIEELIEAGTEVKEEQRPIMPDGMYALHTLRNIPRDDAVEILSKAITTANKFAAVAQKQAERDEAIENEKIDSAINRYFFYEPTEQYRVGDLMEFVPGAVDYTGLDSLPPEQLEKATINGLMMRNAIEDYLNASNAITPELRKKFDDASVSEPIPFASQSNPKMFDMLFGLQLRGNLDLPNVVNNRPSLSREDYQYFVNLVETEEEEAVKNAKSLAQATFQYDEQTAMDPDLGKASKAAFYSVSRDLQEEVARRRLSSDGPMTPSEINQFTINLINNQKQFFTEQLRQDYIGTINRYNESFSGVGLNLSLDDPLGDLEAWYSGIEDQSSQQTNYARIKSMLKREYFDKGFKY